MFKTIKNNRVKSGAILIVIMFGLGCWIFYKSQNALPEKAITGMEPYESIDQLKNDILTKGDKNAYYALQMAYMDEGKEIEFAVWALIMANKYNYTKAYFDVYFSLQMIDDYYGPKDHAESSLDLLDSVSRKMALDYLIIASNKGDWQAKEILGQYYIDGKYLNKDTLLGKKLIEEYHNLRK